MDTRLISIQELVLDVLGASATKRDARSYLARFQPRKPPPGEAKPVMDRHGKGETRPGLGGVNLGSLYLPVRSIDQSPTFGQQKEVESFRDLSQGPLHVAIVVIKSPQNLADLTLSGIGLTLSQLERLGMTCVVLADPGQPILRIPVGEGMGSWLKRARRQARRLVDAVEQHDVRARHFDSVLTLRSAGSEEAHSIKVKGRAEVLSKDILLRAMSKGTIPIILPVGLMERQTLAPLTVSESLLALTREFAGLNQHVANHLAANHQPAAPPKTRPISLDRIIILDEQGGIPSASSVHDSHVFINLEQEYADIRKELTDALRATSEGGDHPPVYRAREHEASLRRLAEYHRIEPHLSNLQLARDALALLPPSSSALITTPDAVAQAHQTSAASDLGVGTRPQRNLLVHNLLTDKPLHSSSLPRTRVSSARTSSPAAVAPPTFIKRGLPLTLIPHPRTRPWITPHHVPLPSSAASPSSDPLPPAPPGLDLPRLTALIEDAFNRPLAARAYFARILPRLAGVVVAGAYAGAAICTWELPPDTPPDLPDDEKRRRLVPYLDKFAVARAAQGSGGVADVVWAALVRECWPAGVCWRSRSGNPANRWYFERARGSWRLGGAGEGWTMFWTTEGVDGRRFAEYESVCRSIGTCWADGKARLD